MDPFEDVFPMDNSGWSIAMLVCQRVIHVCFLVTHYRCSQWTLVAFPTTWHCVGMHRTAWKTARRVEDCDTPVGMVHGGMSIAALRRKLGSLVVK